MVNFAHLQLKTVTEDLKTQENINLLKELYLLSTTPTEQLLELRNQLYRVHSDQPQKWERKGCYEVEGYVFYKNVWISQTLFYRELSKRPHVPNKQEAKQIRSANAKK